MPRPRPNQEFLSEISEQLRQALDKRDQSARAQGKRYTRTDAARDLNISRASLQFYLAGKHTPSSEVLRRAMELWSIELTYRGRRLTILDLQAPTSRMRVVPKQPYQYTLWDSIKRLGDEALKVKVEEKSPQSITLRVEIGFKTG